MEANRQAQLITFLRQDLDLPDQSIHLALDHPEQQFNLPMILWQYGLVSLHQLEQIFDWLENCGPQL